MRVTIDDRLAGLCEDFSVAKISEWLERKFPSYDTSKADLISIAENKNDKEYFKGARLLGFVRDLPDAKGVNHPLLVASVEMRKILTERTSRQAQFSFGKRVLQNAVRSGAAGLNGYPSQGLFFFHDGDGFFRISLVSGEMDGRKFKFNEAKRQSFYIDPNRPNNVAKARLSEPLETYSKLKDAFSVETLTKEFYGKLFDWYEWALKPKTGVTFPNDDSTPDDDRKYNNESIIRLITRLMFTWFIRQRDMVQKELFDIESVGGLLKSFDPKSMEDDNYYRCILQNLFFATFNCQPEKRGFIRHKSGNFSCYSDQHNVKTLYRYEKEFRDPDTFKQLLKKTPFLNCALFDCLDKQEREEDGGRLLLFDGFSDNRKRQAHVPNGLFFHPEKGIIPLFDTYEFTIDENNADDADIALDPELLGKVFENLLGAFNPETQETARKATGSFYTPREIVDYMVEESLKNYLKSKLKVEVEENCDSRVECGERVEKKIEAWLNDLFDKTAAVEKRELPFDDEVAAKIREALYNCKILDPACGSGAFPMGILHCMVRLFGRLDPSNVDLNRRLIMRYKQETNQQRDPSYTELEWQERQEQLKVQLAEGQHYPDYARKLYLIENCIYGVDIQPIATQISKLRFFISLLCDQMRELCAGGGARQEPFLALPNLEAKFVCANTLIALPKTEGELELMSSSKIPRLREKLQENRHRIFAARTFRQKEKLKDRDLSIRDEIRETVRSTLAKPDKELIKVQEEIIAKLRKDRVSFEQPKLVKQQKAVQGDFFAATQSTLGFEMVDANKPKREQIDAQIEFAQRKINSELAKSSAANVTKIDQLASLVAGWDPYDQNASSSFFDSEWMFNLKDGFDIVIGNPPYVKVTQEDQWVEYYKTRYKAGSSGRTNLYKIFVERGIGLLNFSGSFSYIMPNSYLADGSVMLRDFLLQQSLIEIIEYTEKDRVFQNVAQAVTTIVLSNVRPSDNYKCHIVTAKQGDFEVLQKSFLDNDGHCLIPMSHLILTMRSQKHSLSEWLEIYQGEINLTSRAAFYSAKKTSGSLLMWRGDNVGKYCATRLPIEYCRTSATRREHWRKKRIVMKQVTNQQSRFRTAAFISPANYLCGNSTNYLIPLTNEISLKAILGLLNSKAFNYQFTYCSFTNHITTNELYSIRVPDISELMSTGIEGLVDRILAAKKADPDADTSALESQIDQLVYKLYGLTEEEIAVVEGKATDARVASGGTRVSGDGATGVSRTGGEVMDEGHRRGARRARPASVAATPATDDDEELE